MKTKTRIGAPLTATRGGPTRTLTLTGMDVRVAAKTGEIDSFQWDQLVGGDNFFNGSRWIHALELSHGGDPLVVATSRNRLSGLLPTWPGEGNAPGLFCPQTMFPALDAHWPDYLWLGARRSVYNELVCVRGESRRTVLRSLLDGALDLAADAGKAGVVMPYLAAADARELGSVHPRSSVLLHSADANMDVPVGGFAEHLADVSSRDRVRRRKELRTFLNAGNELVRTSVTEEVEKDAVRLITQTRSRYGSTAGPEWMARSLAAQRVTGLLDDAVAFLVKRHGRTIAINLCYPHGDRLYARYFGFDYQAAEPTSEYFILGYREPIDYCAGAGLRRYRLAISAWDLKIRRGATLSPLAAVVVPVEGRLCPPHREAAANAAQMAHWRQVCAHRPAALGRDWNHWMTL